MKETVNMLMFNYFFCMKLVEDGRFNFLIEFCLLKLKQIH